MSHDADAKVTAKGQITIPLSIREKLGVKAGDRVRLHLSDNGELTVTAQKRQSIFERLDELKLPPLGRPLTQADIDLAIGEAMTEQEVRIRKQRR